MRPHEKEPSRGRLPFRWLGTRAALPSLVIGPQIVPVGILGYLANSWLLAALPAVAGSASMFVALRGRRIEPRSRGHLYLGLWPFFAWWSACLVLTAIAPLAVIAAALSGRPEIWLGGAAAVAAGFGVAAIVRSPRITRVRVAHPDLPPELDGYQIAQLSDIHCGAFAPEQRVRDWVRRTNALGADLAVVTGDLIASGTDYVEAVASALGELRAPDGVMACMGNHDYFGTGEALFEALRDRGVRVLRNEHELVRRGEDALVVAGVDDTWTRRDDLDRALDGRDEAAYTLLLSHDPDLFPAAAARGVHLTLSGHTHGGQLAVPLMARSLNLAKLAHAYTSGHYREGRSHLFVHRGAGTSGPPVRIGTRGEIALITLVRDSDLPPARAR